MEESGTRPATGVMRQRRIITFGENESPSGRNTFSTAAAAGSRDDFLPLPLNVTVRVCLSVPPHLCVCVFKFMKLRPAPAAGQEDVESSPVYCTGTPTAQEETKLS